MEIFRTKAAVRGKITVKGKLRLESPLLIGSAGAKTSRPATAPALAHPCASAGVGSQEVDIYALKDKLNRPFIPGSSLAGVLRAAFNDACVDGGKSVGRNELTEMIFGSEHFSGDNSQTQWQSSLIVDDVTLERAEIITRDSVRINAATGTAVAGAKFNYEAVAPGAAGEMCLTLTWRDFHADKAGELQQAMNWLVAALNAGIRLGSRTTKGFGLVRCPQATVSVYDFTDPAAVKAWLLGKPYNKTVAETETALLKHNAPKDFVAEAALSLNGSLLARQTPTSQLEESLPLAAQQLEGKDGTGRACFIIPGATIKGVLRHHAAKILSHFPGDDGAEKLNRLMGSAATGKSRFITEEVYIKKDDVEQEIQARNHIDRFTGGTVSGHLFAEKPIWQISPWEETEDGKPWRRAKNTSTCMDALMPTQSQDATPLRRPTLNVKFCIKDCSEWEAGLALFLLRDLCLGKIAVGGGKSIGRGTLSGSGVTLHYDGTTYCLNERGQVIGEGATEKATKLQNYALALTGG